MHGGGQSGCYFHQSGAEARPSALARPLPVHPRHPDQLSPALVIVARRSRTAIQPFVAALVAALVVVLGCREGAKPAAASARSSKSDTSDRSIAAPSEVVIARPSTPYVTESVATSGSVTGTITSSAAI